MKKHSNAESGWIIVPGMEQPDDNSQNPPAVMETVPARANVFPEGSIRT